MQGELNGRDPMEEVRAIYAVLSRPDGHERHNNLITLAKLQAACHDFEVRVWALTRPPPCSCRSDSSSCQGLSVSRVSSVPLPACGAVALPCRLGRGQGLGWVETAGGWVVLAQRHGRV